MLFQKLKSLRKALKETFSTSPIGMTQKKIKGEILIKDLLLSFRRIFHLKAFGSISHENFHMRGGGNLTFPVYFVCYNKNIKLFFIKLHNMVNN